MTYSEREREFTFAKNFIRSSLERFMRAVQFASVISCARTSPFEAFQLQMMFMMRTTDGIGMPVPRGCAVSSWLVLLTRNYIVHLVNVFIRADTSRSAAALASVHCACVSELLE